MELIQELEKNLQNMKVYKFTTYKGYQHCISDIKKLLGEEMDNIHIKRIKNGYTLVDRYGQERYYKTLKEVFEYLNTWF